MTRARAVAVLGCTSSAGKSLVATALCRWYVRQGLDVRPFKAQNMSNNARVVDGGEIGVAQWLQALAARTEPDVRMNPVLVKPAGDTHSHAIVLGRPHSGITALPWTQRAPLLAPIATQAYDELAAACDLVVIEGAGSPAETNLVDLANNGMVAHADASALLVVDIDRGGAFAHLVGTWQLVPPATRDRLAGFVLNRFRGDPALLAPAPEETARRTGMAAAGVLPVLAHELPDEEGAVVRAAPARTDAATVAVVRGPYASNLDELHLLGHVAHVRFAAVPADVIGADLIVLPGSRHVVADLAWLRSTGLDRAVTEAARSGTRVVGICGGAMQLGRVVDDPLAVEAPSPSSGAGLGLLDLNTRFAATKRTAATTVALGRLPTAFAALDGLRVTGYEIRHGEITAAGPVTTADARVWATGSVLATTVHGLLESPDVLRRLLGARPEPVLERTFDALADAVDEHLDTDLLARLADGR